MKIFLYTLILSIMSWGLGAQESSLETGFAGDHFSLEGAIDAFKNAETLEAFEDSLNKESSNVNNLDLNEDGDIDYIRVIDNRDDEVHAIVLQAVLGENESQDVAVIEIEKDGSESATLQIIGDEDVYGSQKIVEPYDEVQLGQDQKGPAGENYYPIKLIVNVWFYPSVRYIYGPSYNTWVSPYRWAHYPRYWKPWRPSTWNSFHPRTKIWHKHYHPVKTHRLVKAHKVYTPRRTTSVTVKRKTTVVRTTGKAKVGTTKKTKVTKKGQTTKVKNTATKGKTSKVKNTTTKTAVKKTNNGKVKGKKKSTQKVKKKKGN